MLLFERKSYRDRWSGNTQNREYVENCAKWAELAIHELEKILERKGFRKIKEIVDGRHPLSNYRYTKLYELENNGAAALEIYKAPDSSADDLLVAELSLYLLGFNPSDSSLKELCKELEEEEWIEVK